MKRGTYGHLGRGVVAAVMACALAGCGNLGTASVADSLKSYQSALSPIVQTPTIIQEGTLTVGVLQTSSAPLSVVDDGQLKGIDADLASLIADDLGLKVRFVSISDVGDALGKTCDIVLSSSDKDDDGMTVVGSYAERASAFFHKGDATTVSMSDLSGKTVAVQSGSHAAAELASSNLDVETKECSSLDEAFEALDSGEADYVLCGAYTGVYIAQEHDGVSICGTIDEPQTIGVAVSSTNSSLRDQVQNALGTVTSSGLYDIVRSRWVGSMQNLTSADQVQGVTVSSSASGSSSSGSGSSSSSSSSGARLNSVDDEDSSSSSNPGDGSTAGANAVSTAIG